VLETHDEVVRLCEVPDYAACGSISVGAGRVWVLCAA
jgi:hypothetical protein